MNDAVRITYRVGRRIVITVVGSTVVLFGLALLVLPGPGVLVVLTGLAILGAEFAWARVWLRRLRDGAETTFRRFWKREPPR